MNNIDSGVYLLIAISFMKTLVFWLPYTFKIFTDLLAEYFNKQTVCILMMMSLISTLGTTLLNISLGPFVFGFQDIRSMSFRSNILLSQGWFWHVSDEYGSKETLDSLEGIFVPALFACLTFYIWIVSIICIALFVGKVIEDLTLSRKKGKKMAALKY